MKALKILICKNSSEIDFLAFKKFLNDFFECYKLSGWGNYSKSKCYLFVEGEDSIVLLFVKYLQDLMINNQLNISYLHSNIEGLKDFIWMNEEKKDELYLDFLVKFIRTFDFHFDQIMMDLPKVQNLHKYSHFKEIIEKLPTRYIPENIVSKNYFKDYLPYLSSFTSSLSEYTLFRNRFYERSGYIIESIVDDKFNAIKLAYSVKIPSVKIYKNNLEKKDLNINSDIDNIVLKPTNGHTSKDVFIITNNEIISVENRNRITHSDLKLRIEKSIFKRWMIEEYVTSELLGGIPYDVKVFCFYGVVKLILVIDRNNSKLRYDWLDENFSRVNTGRFNDSLFNSEFKDQKAIDYAKIISLEIPTPFLRIDFLYTGENLYLGEITPRPGHFHEFNYEYDNLLGFNFVDAQARLISDLMCEKSFKNIKQLIC